MPSTMITRQLAASQKLMLRFRFEIRQMPKLTQANPKQIMSARIDLLPQETDDGQQEDQHHAAEREHHPGLGCGVAQDLLQELRNHDCGRVKRRADHDHHELRHGEVAAAIEREVDDGMRSGHLAPEKCD